MTIMRWLRIPKWCWPFGLAALATRPRTAIGFLGLVSLQIGAWAQFAPRSFYDSYPGLGHAWVSIDGPFNEHLVRDVGGLNLALAVVLIIAAINGSRPLMVASSLAFLVYGVPHVVYHFAHHESLDGVDAALSVGGLAVLALVAAGVAMAAFRSHPGDPRADRH
jgi:hypothetical protein